MTFDSGYEFLGHFIKPAPSTGALSLLFLLRPIPSLVPVILWHVDALRVLSPLTDISKINAQLALLNVTAISINAVQLKQAQLIFIKLLLPILLLRTSWR